MSARVPAWPFFLGIASAALFGAAAPLTKPLTSHLSPFTLAGLLYLGAAAATLPAVLAGGWRTATAGSRRDRLRLAGAIVSGGLIAPLLLLAGLRLAGAGTVSVLLVLELVATALLGALFFKDHLGRQGVAALALAVVASVLVAASGGGPGGAGLRAGLLVALACLAWALDNNLTALIASPGPAAITFWKGATAGSVNLLAGWALGGSVAADDAVRAMAIGAVCYGASLILFIHASRSVGASRLQVAFATAPIWGLALSVLLLNEPLPGATIGAAALMGIAIALLLSERHSHQHAHEALEHDHSHRHDDGHHMHEHAGTPPSLEHSHPHVHLALVHSHPHQPDQHHRHSHAG